MIVVFGGTGSLGANLVGRLTARGEIVRIASRDPGKARALLGPSVDALAADVRDPAAVARAVTGARAVVLAMHGFAGTGGDPRTVDAEGCEHVVAAARAAGVEHLVMVSIVGATEGHPVELFRMKHRGEQALRTSGMPFTIVRATAFIETWLHLLAAPLAAKGKTVVFGPGTNPINFVSAHDVASVVAEALSDPALRGETIEVAGPDNVSFDQLLDTFTAITGATGKRAHIPLPVMRLASHVMKLVKPSIARQIRAAVVMNTTDMTFDPASTRFPALTRTAIADVVRRDYQ